MATPAILAFADGTVLHGTSVGYAADAVAEIVFNTAMTGYQEIISDPSYAQQLVTLTYPHIGNVGCNAEDMESNKAWLSGLIIRDMSPIYSNHRAQMSLQQFLQQQRITAIADIDTREVTHRLRNQGAQQACISLAVDKPELAIAKAKQSASLQGMDLARVVSCQSVYTWPGSESGSYHVVAYDFGVKATMLNLLAERGCRITVVPAETSATELIALRPQGVFLSNGPGDPAACDYAIAAIKELLAIDMPLFGICLGFQLLALATGGATYKMKFGHHGANHPVLDKATQKVMITSQNHSFALAEESLPDVLEVTHRSLFDNSLQGIRHKSKAAFGFQGHPEGSPGPHDVFNLFDEFIQMLR